MLRILITNDDGINAIGLKILAKVASKYGDVFVIAPKCEQSAKSHSIHVRHPIEFKKVEDILPGIDTYYADSTPADCVRIAYFYLEDNFDIVLSGVNAGFNLGEDITYSGTCAAATEAAMLGRKAVALSTNFSDIDKIEEDLEFTLDYVFKYKLYDIYPLYNINIPLGSRSIRYVRQGKTHYYSYYRNDQGYLSSIGRPEATPDDIELSDVDLTYKKNITIMPMSFNRTNEDMLKRLVDRFEGNLDK